MQSPAEAGQALGRVLISAGRPAESNPGTGEREEARSYVPPRRKSSNRFPNRTLSEGPPPGGPSSYL